MTFLGGNLSRLSANTAGSNYWTLDCCTYVVRACCITPLCDVDTAVFRFKKHLLVLGMKVSHVSEAQLTKSSAILHKPEYNIYQN